MFTDIYKRAQRWFRAEFIPSWIQYVSVRIFCFWKMLWCWSPLWFTATNPGMPLGWLYPTSKRDVLNQIPDVYIPKTLYISQDDVSLYTADHPFMKDIYKRLEEKNMSFPLIIKPDNGVRWLWIEIFHTQQEFEVGIYAYFEQNMRRWAWLLQEFVDHPHEIGVFYVRMPDQKKGKITWLVGKEFLTLIGNGQDTFEQLVHNHGRAKFHVSLLENQFADRRGQVLPEWEHIDIVEIGTHSRGSTFLDVSEYITQDLIDQFDHVSGYIDGFYYGRYDVRTSSIQAMTAGNFNIIEVNMTYSEPTWMYDPQYSLWTQQKILLQHWSIMYDIALANHKNGVSYASIAEWKIARDVFEKTMDA